MVSGVVLLHPQPMTSKKTGIVLHHPCLSAGSILWAKLPRSNPRKNKPPFFEISNIPLIYEKLRYLGFSQCITSFQNSEFWLKKPLDLDIDAHNLFLILLIPLTQSSSQFLRSNPIFHLIPSLLRIIHILSTSACNLNKRRCMMPTYEFYCEECKKSFIIILSISEYEKEKYSCPKCKTKKLKQQISSFQTVTSKKS